MYVIRLTFTIGLDATLVRALPHCPLKVHPHGVPEPSGPNDISSSTARYIIERERCLFASIRIPRSDTGRCR